jgi:hypothetical protein
MSKVIGSVVVVLLLNVQLALAFFSQEYTFIDLGQYFPVTIEKSENKVIASQRSTNHAVQLYPTFLDLGEFSPTAIAGSRVVGDDSQGAVLYENGTLRHLENQGNSFTSAKCVNQDGDVYGNVARTVTFTNSPPRQINFPVVWVQGQTLVELPELQGFLGGFVTACNVSDHGVNSLKINELIS